MTFGIRQDRGKIMIIRDELKRTRDSKTKPKEKKRKDCLCHVTICTVQTETHIF